MGIVVLIFVSEKKSTDILRRSATKPSGPADHRFPGPEASSQKPPDHTDLGPDLHAGQGLKSRNQQHLDSGYDRQELEAPLRSYPPLCDHGHRYGFRRSFLRPASNLLT